MKLIRVTTTRNINLAASDMLQKYPDTDYIRKIKRLNRCAIQYFDEGKLVGFAVLSKKNRFLKLNMLCVHEAYQRKGIASTILKVILEMLFDDFNPTDTLYTVCTTKFNTYNYQSFLVKHGFQLTTIKSNGELVYTYAKSI